VPAQFRAAPGVSVTADAARSIGCFRTQAQTP